MRARILKANKKKKRFALVKDKLIAKGRERNYKLDNKKKTQIDTVKLLDNSHTSLQN